MAVMIIRHKVREFEAWKQAFDAHKPARDVAGLSRQRVLRSVDDQSVVVLIFDTPDISKAKAFIASDDLRTAMKNAGVLDAPDVYFLNEAG
jgi:hypothetical protein